MDAQNAVGPASTKPAAAASLKRLGSDHDQHHHRASSTNKTPDATRVPLISKEHRSNTTVTQDDTGQDGNSDAETIVLPGKDGHSPSKVRKIKNEDKSEAGDRPDLSSHPKHMNPSGNERDSDRKDRDRRETLDKPSVAPLANGTSDPKRKTLLERPTDKPRSKDGSSGLSSAPTSPPQRRRRPSQVQSDSDAEHVRGTSSSKPIISEKSQMPDKLVPHKRKASKAESDDEGESRKVRRQRTSGSGLNASRSNRDSKPPSKLHTENSHSGPPNKSASPPARPHRRSISTQLPPQAANGLSHKKKRIPAPLQSTDYHSDESSASGSPHPRSSKLRGLTTPATADSAISPAKMAPHKKHLDAHGQTFLARACARGEYEVAKTRLQERPGDINVADFAGNTPLQIAALNGYEDIVQLLIDAGCSLDCVNYDKDTPLLDAVDNGHLGVVRLLLAAGVNPRKPNAYGQEPLDRVTDETDNATEIRQALTEAKQRMGERRRTSEEHHPQDHTDARSSHGPESSRRSPESGHAGSSSRRAGTVRSQKTSNHLLYMPMDDKTLRAAAAKGDEETVTRILQVRDTFDDPESMVAAAKGGHETVMNLLLALGGANPDPKPIGNNEFSTPMLAAIGQENIKVVRLLLDQSNFDPTGGFKGETYYEIARRRKGPNWVEEEEMLKNAYDEYRKTRKDSSKTKSPNKREQDHGLQRSRADHKEGVPRSHKRKASSPNREPKKNSSTKASTTSPKEKRRSNSFSANQDDQTSPKRGPGRPRKEDRIPTIAVSDREASPAHPKQTLKTKRTESELAASSEGEAVKPRRKLVSGRELKGEREKQQRRASLTSNTSSLREPPSPRDGKRDEPSEKLPKSEKYHDRTKALKRDGSKDRLSVSGENSGKRHRTSATPPGLESSEKDGSEAPLKKRRLDVDGKERRQKLSSSPDDRPHKSTSNREAQSSSAHTSKQGQKPREDGERKSSAKPKKPEAVPESNNRASSKPANFSDRSIHVKAEDPDVLMRDIDAPVDEIEGRSNQDKAKEVKLRQEKQDSLNQSHEARKRAEERDRKRKEDEIQRERERRRKDEEELKRRAEEERRQRVEEEQRKRKQQEEEEEERKAKKEEERRRQEEEAQQRRQRETEEIRKREEAERKRREEEERKRREEEERRIREEEERKKRIEERHRKEEDERRQRAEEERLRREQLEREAAEEARRRKEEEERRLREEAERKQREEMERRRAREAERLAEQRRIQLEQERLRLSKLPPLLRWLDGSLNPKLAEVAIKFRTMQGVRYDCIRPEATGTADGREQWILNTQVALLLGEKDLTLSRYTAWEHAPVTEIAKQIIWRLEADRYALTSPDLHDLGRQLPDYYEEDPEHMGYRVVERLRREAWEKFATMDMFFVKASDLMFIVPTIPHLRSLELAIAYRELPEHESQLRTWAPLQKWKSDSNADRFHGFAPRNKYYVNGQMVREDRPGMSSVSTSPFPEKRVPRKGLTAVSPDDPDYSRLCREQGLDHLLAEADSPLLPNGVHSSPASAVSNLPTRYTSGPASPTSTYRTTVNGHGSHRPMSPSSDPGAAKPRPLVNGINGSSHGGRE